MARVAVWVLGTILIFSNLGYDVSAFVAGLGISGFAIAFAVRNVIKDVLGSFIIIFDKPIAVGDYIDTQSYKGIVKTIGLKSTRIEDDGKEIVIPNALIVDKVVLNLKGDKFKEVKLSLKIEYSRYKDFPIIETLKTLPISFESIEENYLNIQLSNITTEVTEYNIKVKLRKSKIENIDMEVESIMHFIYKLLKKKRIKITELKRTDE
ncbi:MAG: mechanosensitive ion channel [Candidatus Dojkabacteria bacterium]|nr:mechanosensitive ion channel [Candidatus Dojkabacteria bacterium]MDQ7021144.1 mechanosensitive ion channel [Candidatus Dojkabacteria bacterium]